jgi:FkbM family methyltransferase
VPVRARFGGLPPMASGILTLLVQGRIPLSPGHYASSLAPFDLRLQRFDLAERAFALRGLFEWRIAAIAAVVLSPGDTVFEGGAQLGTETFNYCALVGPDGRVVSYEADARLAARLVREVSRLGATQCQVEAKALGAEEGVALFEVASSPQSNSGLGSLAPNDAPAADRVAVQVETLDAVYEKHGAPQLVVMDIQGGELGALRGAKRVLAEARPVIVLEVESGSLRRLGGSAEDVLDLLKSSGYECWRMNRLSLRRVDRPHDDELGDWLALPTEERDGLLRRIRPALFRGALLPPGSPRSPLSTLRSR